MLMASRQPNLVPPITSTKAALDYKAELQRLAPETEWLMTLYLHPDITPEVIREAAKAGIKGQSMPQDPTSYSATDPFRRQVVSERSDDQQFIWNRRLFGLLPRLQGYGGGENGAEPTWGGAIGSRAKHFDSQRRETLPQAPEETCSRLSFTPYCPRTRHDSRGH